MKIDDDGKINPHATRLAVVNQCINIIIPFRYTPLMYGSTDLLQNMILLRKSSTIATYNLAVNYNRICLNNYYLIHKKINSRNPLVVVFIYANMHPLTHLSYVHVTESSGH